MATNSLNKDKMLPVSERKSLFFSDLRGSIRLARLGAPETPLRRNRFEIDPGLEPAATADMRNDKGNGYSDVADRGVSRKSNDVGDAHVCCFSRKLIQKARKIIKLLNADRGLVSVGRIPSYIRCGTLRASVLSVYDKDQLSLADLLSIKTSQKCETSYCDHCASGDEQTLEEWKERRLQPAVSVSSDLDAFAKAFRGNVPRGWNLRKTAYIPNGHACLGKSRCEGGNWVEGEFSKEVQASLVLSSGKPRVVTLYSEFNVRVLTPLHNSLYSFLRKKDWLLVGSPTERRLRESFSEMTGRHWLSFDYESATDNIKTVYVQRAVEELIDMSEGLSDDEKLCLRTMACLELDGRKAATGQPMGSPMSFPLLCLINKTVVDLALSSLLSRGEIGFQEWTRHRCLINGDDLLTKSTSGGDLVAAVAIEGSKIGLKTNAEKTLRDEHTAEINSTVFVDGRLKKKTNVSALWMRAKVDDVIGFAVESCLRPDSVQKVVSENVSRLRKSQKKISNKISWDIKERLLRNAPIREALISRPVGLKPIHNLFPVDPLPAGVVLSRQEQIDAITSEVKRIRSEELWRSTKAFNANASFNNSLCRVVADGDANWARCARILKHKPTFTPEVTLRCFVKRWFANKYEAIRECREEWTSPPSDFSRIGLMLDLIKMHKDKRNVDRPITRILSENFHHANDGYVSLSDG